MKDGSQVGGWAAGKMEMLLPVQAALVGSRLGKDFCLTTCTYKHHVSVVEDAWSRVQGKSQVLPASELPHLTWH